jgi:hypothetical protein
MQDAETVLGVIRERGRRGVAVGKAVPAVVQQGTVPGGLWAYLLESQGNGKITDCIEIIALSDDT